MADTRPNSEGIYASKWLMESPQTVSFEMLRHIGPEIDHRSKHQNSTEKETRRISVQGQRSAKKHSGTDADIPACKVCGIGRSTARIGCHIDEQCIERRENSAEAVSDKEC